MKSRSIYDLLRADGSIVINKNLARAVGLNEAVIYSELLSRYFYFADRDRLGPDGYFYNTIEDLESGTTLSRRQQDPAIKNLVKLGLIKTKPAGIPAKRHFKVIDDVDYLLQVLDGGRVLPGQKWVKLNSSMRSNWSHGEDTDEQGVSENSGPVPEAVRRGCQHIIDSCDELEMDMTPERFLELMKTFNMKKVR